MDIAKSEYTDEIKRQQKLARQQLKMRCLQLAKNMNTNEIEAEPIVSRAKLLYAFARS